jgi:hypothetical protein
MVNQEHAQVLGQGVEVWNAWRASLRQAVPIDLSYADLRRANLDYADLSAVSLRHASFIDAHLHGANLGGADCSEADFSRADLSLTNFSGANLEGAKLEDSNLTYAYLDYASLAYAIFRDAQLKSTSVVQALFEGAILWETLFVDIDLSQAIGLDQCRFVFPSVLDHRTLARSCHLPVGFLRGCGLSDWEIEAAKLHHAKSEVERTDIMYRALALRGEKPISFYSVFICHSSADKQFARALYGELQDRGVRCWLDEKQILPGEDILDAVDKGVRHWDKVILCCSQSALEESWWVETEIDMALAKEQEIRRTGRKVQVLVPLALDDYVFQNSNGGKRTIITRRNIADFRGYTDGPLPKDELNRLIRSLQLDDTGKERPPKPQL